MTFKPTNAKWFVWIPVSEIWRAWKRYRNRKRFLKMIKKEK